jgi:hypothetical protein
MLLFGRAFRAGVGVGACVNGTSQMTYVAK